MSHPLFDWTANPPRQVLNSDLLRKVQREWPRRVWARVRRGCNDAMACAFFSFWSTVHRLVKPMARLMAYAEIRCSAKMRLAWHAFAPEDFTGEAENFVAQRKYDSLALWYDAVDADRRNAMVPGIAGCYPALRPLQDGYGAEIYHA